MSSDNVRWAWLPKLSLLLSALVYGGFGATFLIAPQLLGSVGVEIARPAGAVELRAIYGGMELGLAIFFTLALSRPAWHRPALWAQALTLGAAAAARLGGLAIAGGGEDLIIALAAAETAGALMGVLALRAMAVNENH
jgi:hypothetical protein